MIKAILACDEEGGVSKKGTIPWPKNSKDLGWFKKNTTNNVVVMGSKTWVDPLMPWPLPNRVNVLATTKKNNFPGADKYIKGNLCKEVETLKKENPDKTKQNQNKTRRKPEKTRENQKKRKPPPLRNERHGV